MTEKRENLGALQRMGKTLKDHAKKAVIALVPQHLLLTFLKRALTLTDCVKILVNCMQNIEKQEKELVLLAQENKKKHIKGVSNLSELTKTIDHTSSMIMKEKNERKTKLSKS